ncbi:MAG: hypothetical protein RQ760_14770 [Sedimentisphaerales bacterium]|nr:hypothetical protein [Sedimentisphaerales bacterium]
MERREKKVKMRSSAIVLCILTMLLLTAPAVWADLTVPATQTRDINYPVTGMLWIYGTANLLTGASVTESIYVQTGGTLNMYSGSVGQGWFVSISTVNEKVTVYGTNFGGDGDFSVPGQVSFPSGSGTLTGTYGDGSAINLLFAGSIVYLEDPVTNEEEVEIDIKPGSYPNSINLKSQGVVPVAVLTTDDFDAADVDPTTVEFAGASPLRWTLCDVDDDGDEDLLFHFKTQELNLDENSTEAELTGMTIGGNDISGTDEVRIVPPKPKKNK